MRSSQKASTTYQCEIQWASSTATPIKCFLYTSQVSILLHRFTDSIDSGEANTMLYLPLSTSVKIVCSCSAKTYPAAMPCFWRLTTWSRIRATNGDITTIIQCSGKSRSLLATRGGNLVYQRLAITRGKIDEHIFPRQKLKKRVLLVRIQLCYSQKR